MDMHDKNAINFRQILTEKNTLPEHEIINLEKQAKHHKQTLFQYVMQHQLISAEKLLEDCATYLHIPMMSLNDVKLDQLSLQNIKTDFIKKYFLLPVEKNNNVLTVVTADPQMLSLEKNIQFQTGLIVQWMLTRYDVLCRLHNIYISQVVYKNTHVTAEILTHQILSDAIHRYASDIHWEPYQNIYRIRIRVDGLLHELFYPPYAMIFAITNCIKVLANIDIAIKRIPQDGRFSFRTTLGFVKDCRVSTYPMIDGEKIVIRLLDTDMKIKKIQELGLNENHQYIILQSLQKPQGLILVTGPTGSGKTITLYTMLNILNQTHRNIATIEDPVEIRVDGLNQSMINPKMQFTFSNALRALLRQDPDVMMVGEIRDQETAEIAIRAAETGHLVLSTLHTKNSVETISRLMHMGIAPFHLANALQLVIAQRLIRKLCAYCKQSIKFSQEKLFSAGFPKKNLDHLMIFEAVGCTQCEAGFRDRIGIFELLVITDEIKHKIIHSEKIQNHFTLWAAALTCVTEGKTSWDEIDRMIPRNENESVGKIIIQPIPRPRRF